MAELVAESAVQETESFYSASWIDRLIEWIDRLPGPAWAFYVAATLALTLLINVVLWVDGSVPFGSYGAIPGIFPPFVFYFLALYHYLTRVGSRSLHAFRPLLDVNDAEVAQIDHELATLPSRTGWLALVIGLLTTPSYIMGDKSMAFVDLVPQTFLPYVLAVVLAGFFGATFFILIIRSIRQLQTLRKLHARAVNIDLLKLTPAHAFSALTARTAIGFFLIVVFGYLYSLSSLVENTPATVGLYISFYLVTVILAIVVFVLPIIGMRDRLEEEKGHLLDKTNNLLQTTEDRFHSNVENSDYAELRGMETAIDMLINERERIEKISTWPWNPATFRAFGSTLLLPIILRIATQLVGNFF